MLEHTAATGRSPLAPRPGARLRRASDRKNVCSQPSSLHLDHKRASLFPWAWPWRRVAARECARECARGIAVPPPTSLIWMDGFVLLGATTVRGFSLKLHGSSTLFYGTLADCAATCAAALECASFVHHGDARPRFCSFKRAALDRQPHAEKELFVKQDWLAPSAHPSSSLHAALHARLQPVTAQLGRGQRLGNSSRIFLLKGLIAPSEAEALRHFASDCLRRQRSTLASTARARTEQTTVGSTGCPAGAAAALLSTVEARLGALTGIPWNEEEEPLMLTLQRPQADGAWLDGSRLHHDLINAEKARRQVTVLTYLSTVEDAEGGHTIFPGLQAATADGASPSPPDALRTLEAAAQAMQRAFALGLRSLGCHQCAQHAPQPPSADDLAAIAAAERHGEAECERALRAENVGVAVRPTAGDALIFWHVLPDGSPDIAVWHAGCLGRSGSGRVALQKFKTPLSSETERWLETAREAHAELLTQSAVVGAAGVQGMEAEWSEHYESLTDSLATAEHVMSHFMEMDDD